METPPHEPPMRKSDESSEKQLKLARRQGDALQEAVDAMDEESSSGVLTVEAGEYEVALAVEDAEGMWVKNGNGQGGFEWQNPDRENCHIEVCVRDGADGRFIPALDVAVSVRSNDHGEVGTHPHPFLWHPWLYHYGRNWEVPADGDYRIEVQIAEPTFPRHDHENGRRFTGAVTATFESVPIKRGQKRV